MPCRQLLGANRLIDHLAPHASTDISKVRRPLRPETRLRVLLPFAHVRCWGGRLLVHAFRPPILRSVLPPPPYSIASPSMLAPDLPAPVDVNF